MEATIEQSLRAQLRRSRANEWLRAGGCLLAGVPVFLVNYAFVLVSILYFYYLARVRAKALPPEDTINQAFAWLRNLELQGFGPGWWAVLALGLLCGVYFGLFRRPRHTEPELLTESDSGRMVMLVPEEARPHERTSLRRATPGFGGMLFTVIFVLPMLLEGAWHALIQARRLRRVDCELCADALAEIDRQNGTVEIASLEDVLGTDRLRLVLPQLWLLEGITLHADEPQRIQMAELARDDMLILSVA